VEKAFAEPGGFPVRILVKLKSNSKYLEFD
jgi:hypothetical protein